MPAVFAGIRRAYQNLIDGGRWTCQNLVDDGRRAYPNLAESWKAASVFQIKLNMYDTSIRI
jgi:hypothetical protein